LIAIVIVLSAVVLLLAVLVAGLLRSHADILKALHDLGVGVGDPTGAEVQGAGHEHHQAGAGGGRTGPVAVPFTMGPPLPGERSVESTPTISGVTPGGDALAVSVTGGDQLTLLAFLSSGCSTCAGFWQAFSRPDQLGLPLHTRLVVVTKGPEMEIPAEVAAHTPPGLAVVMSTEAWGDYEVPGSPFFVLIDGRSGRRIGEGVAQQFHQVVELVRRAEVDAREFHVGNASRAYAEGLDGPERESANDRELMAAGILPGDPSLYPSSLEEIYGPNGGASAGASGRAGVSEPTAGAA
jgi:hypothetical protein